MAHPDTKVYCIEFAGSGIEAVEDKFNEVMNAMQDAHIEYEQKIAAELSVSETCASNIVYLRSRSRWTQEAENELIRRDKAGEPAPNIMEWP